MRVWSGIAVAELVLERKEKIDLGYRRMVKTKTFSTLVERLADPPAMTALGQGQNVGIKNIKAHHRSGSFSTRRRSVAMACCHSSRSESSWDQPGRGASGCSTVSTSRLINAAPIARRSAIRLFNRAMASSRVVPSARARAVLHPLREIHFRKHSRSRQESASTIAPLNVGPPTLFYKPAEACFFSKVFKPRFA